MELTEYHYVYYSYEEYGRGYIGSRTCKCLPKEDIKYFGSFKDKSFKPKHKIILKDDYLTREEAYADEITLQQYYKVVENQHFANRSYQTSTKFSMYGGKFTEEHKRKLNQNRRGIPRTDEVKKKISDRLKERYAKYGVPQKGVPKSKEHREKLSNAHTGKVLKESTKQKIKEHYNDNPHPFAEHWRITFINGQNMEVFSLNRWAVENGYSTSALCSVKKGIRKRHKDIIKVEKIS